LKGGVFHGIYKAPKIKWIDRACGQNIEDDSAPSATLQQALQREGPFLEKTVSVAVFCFMARFF